VRPRGLNAGVPKLVYAYTPARYLWTPELDPRGNHPAVRAAAALLKPLDRRRAQEATAIAGISRFIADRIERTWERPAEVIHPPVEVAAIHAVADWTSQLDGVEADVLASLPDDFVLGASRMVPYKRLDRVIRAGELSGRPVVLAGGGPEEGRLRERAARATVPVHVVPTPSTPLLFALYQRCATFVFLPVEDFGIMPIEALAAGAPVVVNRVGGAAETLSIVGAEHGGVADPDDDDDLADAVGRVIERSHRVPPAATGHFARARFVDEIRAFVARHTT
jgi:glycosyltransferase involved in cell wall biosynthesis